MAGVSINPQLPDRLLGFSCQKVRHWSTLNRLTHS
nr:MAG TPA: hypothetical protein [Caudoviricetes sp.]